MLPEVHLTGHAVKARAGSGTSAVVRNPALTHVLTLGLALLASNLLAIAKADGEYTAWWWIERGVETVLVIAAAVWCHRRAKLGSQSPAVSPALVLLVLATLLWEPLQRSLLETGRPFEILVMDALRVMVLGLAAASSWASCQRLAAGASLFLVMFGAMLSFTPLVHALVGMYAAGALGWLAATYWDSLRARLIASQERVQPRWGLIALVALFGVAAVGVGATNRNAIVALRGFMPSSGGNRWNDPHARSGVGDGDLLVAGTENIQSFAPIEDAPFVDDHLPGLYDVVNETAGEPRKIPPRSGLRVAVPQEFAAKLKQHLHTRSEKAAREFSTLRRAVPPKQRKINNIHSDALLYVAGRTPLHLRMEVYSIFDGVDWLPEPPSESLRQPELKIVEVEGRPWLQLDDRARWAEYLATAETHAIKPVRLGTSVIPLPPHLHGIHIDMVRLPQFYEWTSGGLIRMKRDEIPSGIAIHLASRPVDAAVLAAERSVGQFVNLQAEQQWLPETVEPERLRELAVGWTAGTQRGWGQIQTVVEKLRTEYVLDREIELGSDERSSVLEFLFERRRGPDYQFATATALLLRSLGYSTRLVSGLYADPAKYDAHLRHTPVLKEDVHFWTEVHVGGGEWLTLEPTPGYRVLGPPPDLWERTQAAWVAAGVYLRTHAAVVGVALLLLVWGWRERVRLQDAAWTLFWRSGRRRSVREQILATWQLVERRLKWSGYQRPAGVTLREWVRQLDAAAAPAAQELAAFLTPVEWAAFAPAESGFPLEDPVAVCQRVVAECSLRRLQTATEPGDT